MARDTTYIDAAMGADGSWKEHRFLQADGKGGHIFATGRFPVRAVWQVPHLLVQEPSHSD
jgi:hypothetical protein